MALRVGCCRESELVDRCVPFLSTLPRKLLPYTSNLLLCQDISHFCKFLKVFIVFSKFLKEAVVIIKFILKYTKNQQRCHIFFNGSFHPCSLCNILEIALLALQGSFFINL